MNRVSILKEGTGRLLRALAIGVALFIVSIVYLYPQVFYCETISLSSFRNIGGRIFVSPAVKSKSYKQIQAVVTAASARVDSFYVKSLSRPRIIVCSDSEQYKKYCNSVEGAGCSLGTPWGNAYVVVNIQDLNIDVMSHEMSHVELLAQVGWWKTLMQIPQWFNEGVALMLDRRFISAQEPAERYLGYRGEWVYYRFKTGHKLPLKDIESFKGFFNGDSQHVMFAYMSSGMEISYWLALSGPSGFSDLLEELKKGQKFDIAYNTKLANARQFKLPANPLRRDIAPKSSF